MDLKEGVAWDINQSKIISIDPLLSLDIISNEFRKEANKIPSKTNDLPILSIY